MAAALRERYGRDRVLVVVGRSDKQAEIGQVDIEKVANEVYRQILALMDAARARNGEPYL